MSAFTFDAASGALSGPTGWPRPAGVPERGTWSVCEHLRSRLTAFLTSGAAITSVTGEGAWSQIDLDVALDRGPRDAAGLAEPLPSTLLFWTNTDSHYPLASGLHCPACRQTLSWPAP
jgi:hypothetical protein